MDTLSDIKVHRKLDTVQLERGEQILLTMTAEDALKLAEVIMDSADKILRATLD